MKKVLLGLAGICIAGVFASQAVNAQDDTAQRKAFAYEHCKENKWRLLYERYQDCYTDYYYSYPNDPNEL